VGRSFRRVSQGREGPAEARQSHRQRTLRRLRAPQETPASSFRPRSTSRSQRCGHAAWFEEPEPIVEVPEPCWLATTAGTQDSSFSRIVKAGEAKTTPDTIQEVPLSATVPSAMVASPAGFARLEMLLQWNKEAHALQQ